MDGRGKDKAKNGRLRKGYGKKMDGRGKDKAKMDGKGKDKQSVWKKKTEN
jgi:hypothetical protein